MPFAFLARLVAAQQVGELAAGYPDQPGQRVVRETVTGPLGRGGDEGLLRRVLGQVEVPVAAGDRAEDLRRQAAQQVLFRRFQRQRSSLESAIGRTSA